VTAGGAAVRGPNGGRACGPGHRGGLPRTCSSRTRATWPRNGTRWSGPRQTTRV